MPGLWAGFWFVSPVPGLYACFLVTWFVCWPVCGVWFLVFFFLPGMLAWSFWLVCRLAFGCFFRVDAPLPMFIGEVLSVCCSLVALMSAKLIYVLSSFHMLFCAFYIHIHVKLIKFPLNLVL